MKKRQILIATLCASALVLSACTIGRKPTKKKSSSVVPTSQVDPTSQVGPSSQVPGPSSGGTSASSDPTPVKVLKSIDVTTQPTRTTYTAGEAFDPTGMVVTATYSNGETANVTSSCTYAPSTLTSGTTKVTISFGGKTTSVDVTVSEPAPTAWSADQLAVLNKYLRGESAKIPYKYVQGAELFRDEEYVVLTYGGGTDTCSEAFIQEYAALFGSEWNIQKNELYSYFGMLMYEGELVFEEGTDDEWSITVSLYGVNDEGDISADGSGHFGMDLSDGAYYSWAEFAEDYQTALDTVYDQADPETQQPIEFPDTVEFPGSVSQIIVEDSLDSNGYYFAQMKGVSEADYYSFLDAFPADKWGEYEDKLNNGFASYYHLASEKVAIGYFYRSSDSTLFLLIHQYEKIYNSWDEVSPVVDAFVDTINDQTTVVIPALAADFYVVKEHADDGYVGAFAFGSETEPLTQEIVDAYVAALDPTVWTSEVIEEEKQQELRDDEGYLIWFETEAEAQTYITENGIENAVVESGEDEDGVFYYIVATVTSSFYAVRSSDYALDLQVAFNEDQGYAAVIAIPRAPLAKTFSSDAVVAMYAEQGITIESFPAYVVADSVGGFEQSEVTRGLSFAIYGSTAAELETFLSGLTGWVLDEEASAKEGEGVSVYMYGETKARLIAANMLEEPGVHAIVVQFDVLKTEWEPEQIADFQETLHGAVPPFFDVALTKTDHAELGTCYYFEVGESVTDDLRAAYNAFVADANWVQNGTYVDFVYTCADGGTAEAFWAQDGNFYIIYEEPAPTAWTEDQIAEFEAKLHFVPAFNELTSGLKWTSAAESPVGKDCYYEVIEGTKAAMVTYLTSEGFAEDASRAYTDEDNDPHNVYVKSVADGIVVFDLCEFEYDSATYLLAAAYFESGSPVPPTPGEQVTLTVSMGDYATDHGCTISEGSAATVYTSLTLDDNITISTSGQPNNGAFYGTAPTQWRLYQTKGGDVTFTAAAGYTIVSVTVEFTVTSNGTLLNNGTAVVSGTAVDVNASSITFTVGNSGTATNGQVRITSVTVVYAPAN